MLFFKKKKNIEPPKEKKKEFVDPWVWPTDRYHKRDNELYEKYRLDSDNDNSYYYHFVTLFYMWDEENIKEDERGLFGIQSFKLSEKNK